MSYCRWSSDDFQCDVYVYADCGGGWTTHVASNRPVLPPELQSELDDLAGHDQAGEDPEGVAWYRRHQVLMNWLRIKEVTRVILTAASAGHSFNDPSPGACADRLEALRAEGLNVPQYAIDELREEQAAMDAGQVVEDGLPYD